jgi:hypothetical protein
MSQSYFCGVQFADKNSAKLAGKTSLTKGEFTGKRIGPAARQHPVNNSMRFCNLGLCIDYQRRIQQVIRYDIMFRVTFWPQAKSNRPAAKCGSE